MKTQARHTPSKTMLQVGRQLARRFMLDTSLPVASGSCEHSLTFILNNFPDAAASAATGDAEFRLPITASAIYATGAVRDAL